MRARTLRAVWVVVVVVTLVPVSPAAAQPATGEEILRPLLAGFVAALNAGGHAEEWLARHRDELTPEVIQNAHLLAARAMQGGRLDVAEAASLFASLAATAAGDLRTGLLNWIDVQQIAFLRADSEAEYRAVREEALRSKSRAEGVGAHDLEFRAATLAADAAYFASTKLERGNAWIRLALSDLVAAAQAQAPDMTTDWGQRYASLLTVVGGEALYVVWPSPEREPVEANLRALASVTQRSIPVDASPFPDTAKSLGLARTLARLSYRYGDPRTASRRLQAAARRALQDGDIDGWLALTFARYQGDRDAGAQSEDLRQLRGSLRAQAAQLRDTFRSRAGRLWVAQRLDPMLGEMLSDELRDPAVTPVAVFTATEAAKARLLHDQIETRPLVLPEAAMMEAAPLERTAVRFLGRPGSDPGQAELFLVSRLPVADRDDDPDTVRRIADLERLYRTHGAGFTASPPPPALPDVVAALEPGEAIIEYVMPFHWADPTHTLFALVITGQGARLVALPLATRFPPAGIVGRMVVDREVSVDSSPLVDAVLMLRRQIRESRDDAARVSLRRLHDLLVAPLIAAGIRPVDFRRWVIVPHGVLHQVPFAALVDAQGRHLIEDVALSAAPSVALWFHMRARPRPPVTTFAGFTDPIITYATVPRLSGAAEEVKAIAGTLGSVVATGADATRARGRSEAVGRSIVHFATHGEFPDADALDGHALMLAASPPGDGRLRADEIRTIDLSRARLAVLSVCNGGLYRFGAGDEPYGLLAAFLAAGVENVVAPLWAIEDDIGSAMIASFYEKLPATDPAEALRAVARTMIEEKHLIQRWAAFVVVGPSRRLW